MAYRVIQRAIIWLVFSFAIATLSTSPTQAHFSVGTQIRSVVIAVESGVLVAYVRTPAPLVFAEQINAAQEAQQPLASPFLRFESTGPLNRYRLHADAIAANQPTFENLLRDTLVFSQSGLDLEPHLSGFSIRPRNPGTPFNSVAIGEAAVAATSTRLDAAFGDAVIDYKLVFPEADPEQDVSVRAAFAPLTLGEGVRIDNHLVDARVDPPVSLTDPGQLQQPVVFDGSLVSMMIHFVHQGMLHILEGLDHVFLVVAMALGVASIRKLLLLVTAFTLGHSVTLIATFLGATPAWPWFIPAVEAAIAASVLYAAAIAIVGRHGAIAVFAAIGLLHGLGFSFVLGDILGRDAPDLVPALLSFNIGIEIGQLLILSLTLGLAAAIRALARPVLLPARIAVLSGIILVSGWWIFERVGVLL